MSLDSESRFVAQPGQVGIGPDWSPNRAYGQMYGFLAVLVAGIFAVPVLIKVAPKLMGSVSLESKTGSAIALGVGFGFLLLVAVAIAAHYRRHNRQEIVIGVTGEGLTVSKRRGDVYPFSEMAIGPWGWGAGAMGSALHLHCGRDRFVLGGRDYQMGAGANPTEEAVPGVDAWLPDAEFEQLLAVVARRAGLDVRRPAPGGPVRCILSPNPQRVQALSPSAVRKQHKLLQSAPSLALEVGADVIRVCDPSTNALIATASPAQVTATPVVYQYPYGHWYPSLNNVVSDIEMQYLSKAPELVLSIPGMQRLSISCLDVGGPLGVSRRFSWRGDVPAADEPAAYAVSGADWLTLVQKFGLGQYLDRRD